MNSENKRAKLLDRMNAALQDSAPRKTAAGSDVVKEPMPASALGSVAIVGVSGYFPGSDNVHQFWEAIDQDRRLISEIPQERIAWGDHANPVDTVQAKRRPSWAGLIPDIKQFDPAFFGILPSEARLMDPRKRLLLMAVYNAIEDAGFAPKSLKNTSTGVFIAVEDDEYGRCLAASGIYEKEGLGPSSSLIANQISYFLDLRGPSEVINTMCSGAAVAIHRAVGALRSGEITTAIVGGANLLLDGDAFTFLSESGQMSTTGSVRSFGKGADGYLRADGVAAIVLKPLSAAVAEKDDIYAVIRNTAVNFNGRGGLSMASPNIDSHVEVIRACYEGARVDPRHISYIEAQGMGNPVADMAEWEACNRALKGMAKEMDLQLESGSCRIGTLKPMIGHMHAASALGALLKIIRSLRTNKLHKIIDFQEANPDLDLENQPCRLLAETEQWDKKDYARLAGIHSYGSGGNNAHVLIEEYIQPVSGIENAPEDRLLAFPVSAETEKQCKTMLENLVQTVMQNPGFSLSDIAYTLQVGRDELKYRLVVVAGTRDEFLLRSRSFLDGEHPANVFIGSKDPGKREQVAKDTDDVGSKAQAWANGAVLSWTDKKVGLTHQRLHLPAYVFNCKPYWIELKRYDPAIPEEPIAPAAADLSEKTGDIVKEVLAAYLLVDVNDIDIHKQFSELGFDSVFVTKLSATLRYEHGFDIEPAMFFEHTTPFKLIRFLSGSQQQSPKEPQLQPEKQVEKPEGNAVAIIGISGRFPQSPTLDVLWENLSKGVDCIQEIPKDRWSIADHFEPDKEKAKKEGKSYGKWGGFIGGFCEFDPLFFNISPSETDMMSPKERLFLQQAWHALEDSGYTPEALREKQVGVFAGVTRSGLDPYRTSPFTVANRVSYVLNFDGPSMTLDTACSSSLVAIHEACRHIHTGECEMALAGGAHVFLDPSHFAMLSGMYMLSPDGSCKSFGEKANGMVPGEGVGVLVLKSLAKAIADKDHIYGVIKGSATNHGGKTNGFTVPNPKAHQKLIEKALMDAGVHAREVSYIEAHGTGTTLGDPIEVRGLVEAFRPHTNDRKYCSLGSVKSNIGHLEAAAGISGVMKILLQMKHKKIAPSLHSGVLNPQVDLKETPFYVPQTLEDWSPTDGDGNRIDRIACVSSFGAGGSNAHVVIEEYINQEEAFSSPVTKRNDDNAAQLFTLSAKDKSQLDSYVDEFIGFLQRPEVIDELRIQDLVYTLQMGRIALEERLAIPFSSIDELVQKLRQYRISGGDESSGVYSRNIVGQKRQELPEPRLSDVREIAGYWIRGGDFDWDRLYRSAPVESRPRRLSLPVYPFKKEFYGLPELSREAGSMARSSAHPLLHQNNSTFYSQRYSASLSGDDFFLKDHVVNGEHILPGVAYLEMAHAGVREALSDRTDLGDSAISLKHVAWIQPARLNESVLPLHIRLSTERAGEVDFEITRSFEEGSGLANTHCQGVAALVDRAEDEWIAISSILPSGSFASFTKEECYHAFERMGVSYGPSFQGIEKVEVSGNEILAKLRVPAGVEQTISSFYLHPSIMDGALQSILCFLLKDREKFDGDLPLAIPFALENILIYHPCTEEMWAHIKMKEEAGITGNKKDFDRLSFDIQLLDASGKLCVKMEKYTARVIAAHDEKERKTGKVFLAPGWKPQSRIAVAANLYQERVVVLCPEVVMGELGYAFSDAEVLMLSSANTEIGGRFADYAVQLFELLQRLMKGRAGKRVLIQLAVPAEGEAGVLGALFGVLKTAHNEDPGIFGQLIYASRGWSNEELCRILDENSRSEGDIKVRYSKGVRELWELAEHKTINDVAGHPWKDAGVYLLSGGIGGLGLLFTKEILEKTNKATVILAGRSPMDVQKGKTVEELNRMGGKVVYRQTDVTDYEAVKLLVEDIVRDCGRLDGVIHCAGVLQDGLIINKKSAAIAAVLAPKLGGLLHLNKACAGLPLDLFVLCSSTASKIGNVGQSDYSIANGFLDEYASYRNASGSAYRMISVSWPLWQEGGMRVDEKMKQYMFEEAGMLPLTTREGMQALYDLLSTTLDQPMVLFGDAGKIRNKFLTKSGASHQPAAAPAALPLEETSGGDSPFREKAIAYFKKILSAAIKLSPDRINAEVALEKYGIDSIMVMQMTNDLTKVFGSLPMTLFFEYQNIGEVTDYFIRNYAVQLKALLAPADGESSKAAAGPARRENSRPIADLAPRKFMAEQPGKKENRQEQEEKGLQIAIIGVAGRYPQARNLGQFWENLCNGKNSITEIPESRWDHTPYFDKDKHKMWKTYSRWGGFLDDVDRFDPLFFNISPREAEILDPQERIFLECAYSCIEDAGYTRQQLNNGSVQGNVGVYVGVMWTEYQLYGAQETALGRSLALSSSASSIANRVSYFCNFNGPSLALDTMCSSSLTAIHLACQSLAQGECKVAIAGGVNVSIHPNKYLVLGYGKLASTKGLCESFGMNGDGYVPGEGVGAVLLKPLAQAIEDGDQIYGVIRGTAINHGGKVNGYSVPNPKAQGKAIQQAISLTGFDPRTISYIEAHGTGTALGDPIEIAGLINGFQTEERQFCAVGSVKSNIGHCESAAGIAGISKVLLQMKHRQLVPSLHSKVLNPNIDFSNSPFYVQQELSEWRRPVVKLEDRALEYPRRAGISSFGAGGANAHIIIEEYVPDLKAAEERQPGHPVAIVLSARTAERLKALAGQLLAHIRTAGYSDRDLESIAYTLQVGREAFEERLGMELGSIAELEKKLAAFADGETAGEEVFSGNVHAYKDLLPMLTSDEDTEKMVESWLRKRKFQKVLSLWVKGLEVDWTYLYAMEPAGQQKPRRISLPSYPYLRNRYWPEVGPTLAGALPVPASTPVVAVAPSSVGHPLIHQNISTFYEQKFRSVFTGKEFFLEDHLVNGVKVLPGVAYLEMVNEAMASASGHDQRGIWIENIVWSQPFSVNGHSRPIEIGLMPTEAGDVDFRIYSESDDEEKRTIIHSQGLAKKIDAHPEQHLDIKNLQATLGSNTLDAASCYEMFSKMGISYGPAQRAIEQVYLGDDRLLAKLTLPGVISDTIGQYHMHPSLMDASLQSVIGFLTRKFRENGELPLAVPFSMKSVKALHPCSPTMWVYVRQASGPRAAGRSGESDFLAFDIDILDEKGRLCVQIIDFSSRVVRAKGSVVGSQELLLLEPVWESNDKKKADSMLEVEKHLIVLLDDKELARQIGHLWPEPVVKCLTSQHPAIEDSYQQYALQLFAEVRTLLGDRPKEKVLLQVIAPAADSGHLYEGLAGLLKTAQLENPLFVGQLICLEERPDAGLLIEKLKDEMRYSATDVIIRYRDGERSVNRIREIQTLPSMAPPIWKEEGVYLITGGCGGLGILVAKEIAACVRSGVVILTGRSGLDEKKQQLLEDIRKPGIEVRYIMADIANKREVDLLIDDILLHHGHLNGIVHSAGVLRDSFILKKTDEQIADVLAPKVKGVSYLDAATRDLPLDFLILCSSTTGVTGNAGQADYAMANAFMDRFAAHRNQLTTKGLRKGAALSVNWPLLKEGGMRLPKENEEDLKKRYGMEPLETRTGLDLLYRALLAGKGQIMAFAGEPDRLRTAFFPKQDEKERSKEAASAVTPMRGPAMTRVSAAEPTQMVASKDEKQEVLALLAKTMSKILKLAPDQISFSKPFDEYGIDSVVVIQLTNDLEKVYGNLPKTLFFEYRNLNEMADYLVRSAPGVIRGVTASAPQAAESMAAPVDAGRLLKAVLSGVIKLPVEQIGLDAPFDEYGVDSVMVMQMTNELEKTYGNLPKTLFFEYSTIRELAKHLAQSYRAKQNEPEIPVPPAAPRPEAKAMVEPPAPIQPPPSMPSPTPAPGYRFAASGEKKNEPKSDQSLDIAIVGLAGRYPDAPDLDAFWDALKSGRNCVTEIPGDRWDYQAYFDKTRNVLGKTYGKWGGFLDGYDEFDPLFFGISAKEAEGLDPQERLFLQTAWHALEDAGYSRDSIGFDHSTGTFGNVGVYAGAMWNEYQLYGAQETALGRPLTLSGITASIANRVSWFCNFNGPSITLNTMCSSSLIAIHLACRSILDGECVAAIAGGVNLNIHPNKYMALGYANLLSSKGLCESFAAGADGYVPGEGVGAVLLKPLANAIADQDHIYGVIKGSAVNHNGKTNSYMVPNPKAQGAAVDKAMRMAGFDPETIGYIEAQGTGTDLGDSIEIAGLNRVFRTADKHFCPIGSVKSNIGHCEGAAGIAALTKVLLQMKHGQIVPSLHSQSINPNIELAESAFYVPQGLSGWKRVKKGEGRAPIEYPRRAGISAFGAGGANVHIVLEEYIPGPITETQTGSYPSDRSQKQEVILLSAKNKKQLKQKVDQLLAWIDNPGERNEYLLQDIAYTLQVGRDAMKERIAFKADSLSVMRAILQEYAAGKPSERVHTGMVYNRSADLSEEETAALTDKLILQGDFDQLMGYWTSGLPVDWGRLYKSDASSGRRRQRIALPVYPFAKDRYWHPRATPLKMTIEEKLVEEPLPSLPVKEEAIAVVVASESKVVPTREKTQVVSALQQQVEEKLTNLFSGVVGYSKELIDPKESIFCYGIDSIMIQMLEGKLTDIYDELPAGTLSRFQTLESLSDFLSSNHTERSTVWVR